MTPFLNILENFVSLLVLFLFIRSQSLSWVVTLRFLLVLAEGILLFWLFHFFLMERLNLKFLYGLQEKANSGLDGMLFVLQFCMNIGLISKEYECSVCKKSMKLHERPQACDGYEWMCRTRKIPSHTVRRSIRNGTWFAASRLSICDILLMTEFFVRERSQKDVMYELGLGADTVCNWRSCFRELCVTMFSCETDMIGGVDKIVEMYESKFGKNKYSKSKHMDGKWVFGGVERGSNKCFLRVFDKKDKAILLNVIKFSILPGTTILSDCWKSYDTLNDKGFQQLADDRSLFFKNLETGVHTTSIEGIWSAMKRSIPSRTVTDQFDAYLGEYLWRRHHSGDDDLMATFLEGITRVYPPMSRDSVGDDNFEEQMEPVPGNSQD